MALALSTACHHVHASAWLLLSIPPTLDSKPIWMTYSVIVGRSSYTLRMSAEFLLNTKSLPYRNIGRYVCCLDNRPVSYSTEVSPFTRTFERRRHLDSDWDGGR
ncbi:hypothetical protein C8Q80DRAFT_785886 [Daedaleopsis nitida]|nr:hypothetical protein C8Q80DRAFT_785886 [Daedaleopsis nitida]